MTLESNSTDGEAHRFNASVALLVGTHVSDHDGLLRAAAQVSQGLQEEGLLWLANHSGLGVCGVLQPCHKGPRTQSQPVLALVVARFVDGDEWGPIQDQT